MEYFRFNFSKLTCPGKLLSTIYSWHKVLPCFSFYYVPLTFVTLWLNSGWGIEKQNFSFPTLDFTGTPINTRQNHRRFQSLKWNPTYFGSHSTPEQACQCLKLVWLLPNFFIPWYPPLPSPFHLVYFRLPKWPSSNLVLKCLTEVIVGVFSEVSISFFVVRDFVMCIFFCLGVDSDVLCVVRTEKASKKGSGLMYKCITRISIKYPFYLPCLKVTLSGTCKRKIHFMCRYIRRKKYVCITFLWI